MVAGGGGSWCKWPFEHRIGQEGPRDRTCPADEAGLATDGVTERRRCGGGRGKEAEASEEAEGGARGGGGGGGGSGTGRRGGDGRWARRRGGAEAGAEVGRRSCCWLLGSGQQGYTDSQGRHYPRLPGPLLDYYNSADGDVSNQISRHHNLPAVPYTRHNRWRHRPAYNDRSEEGVARGRGGRGGRRRGNRDPAAAARRDQRRCAASPPGRPGGRRRRQRAVATGAAASQDVQWGAVSIPHRGRQRHCCSVLRGQPQ
ncbi:Protein of unknown function, partial [Gryllus bimaculatus]